MKDEKQYSDKWIELYDSAKIYQKKLKLFLKIDNHKKIEDLKKALLNSNMSYYALKVIGNLSKEMRAKFLKEFIYLTAFARISEANTAKEIIKSLDIKLERKRIGVLVGEISLENKNDKDVIYNLAIFLFELKYKIELLDFIRVHRKILKETGYIQSGKDLQEIEGMKDLNED